MGPLARALPSGRRAAWRPGAEVPRLCCRSAGCQTWIRSCNCESNVSFTEASSDRTTADCSVFSEPHIRAKVQGSVAMGNACEPQMCWGGVSAVGEEVGSDTGCPYCCVRPPSTPSPPQTDPASANPYHLVTMLHEPGAVLTPSCVLCRLSFLVCSSSEMRMLSHREVQVQWQEAE